MKKPKPKKCHWFAGSKEILRMGPYPSQVAAWEALRAADSARVHVRGAYVWCERPPMKKD